MNSVQQSPKLSAALARVTWAPTDDLVRLDQIVRSALDDPCQAACQLAHWLDCQTTHHEGSDAARILDDWAFDPSADSLDSLAGHIRASKAPLPVRVTMMAILAGPVAWMADFRPLVHTSASTLGRAQLRHIRARVDAARPRSG